MRRLVLASVLLVLAACSPAEAPKQEAAVVPAPAPSPSPFAGDLNALGTEPFWAVEVRADALKLSRPDAPDVVVPNPGPRLEGGKAIWPAQGLVLTLTEGQCSDGMSDRTYPWYAEVTTSDATLKGCATRAAALTQAPRP